MAIFLAIMSRQSQYLISPSQPHVATLLVSSGCQMQPMHGVRSCAGMLLSSLPGCCQSHSASLPVLSPLITYLPSGEKPTCTMVCNQ